MQQSRHDETCQPSSDEDDEYIDSDSDSTSNSTSDSDTDSVFDHSDDDATWDTNLETLLEAVNNDKDDLSDDEEQNSPEHYLAAQANLDVTQIRQERYSPRTQSRLDWVKEHYDQ